MAAVRDTATDIIRLRGTNIAAAHGNCGYRPPTSSTRSPKPAPSTDDGIQ